MLDLFYIALGLCSIAHSDETDVVFDDILVECRLRLYVIKLRLVYLGEFPSESRWTKSIYRKLLYFCII